MFVPVPLYAWLRDRISFSQVQPVAEENPKKAKSKHQLPKLSLQVTPEGVENLLQGELVEKLLEHYRPRKMAENSVESYKKTKERIDTLRHRQEKFGPLRDPPPWCHPEPVVTGPKPIPELKSEAAPKKRKQPKKEKEDKDNEEAPPQEADSGKANSKPEVKKDAPEKKPPPKDAPEKKPPHYQAYLRPRIQHWAAVASLAAQLNIPVSEDATADEEELNHLARFGDLHEQIKDLPHWVKCIVLQKDIVELRCFLESAFQHLYKEKDVVERKAHLEIAHSPPISTYQELASKDAGLMERGANATNMEWLNNPHRNRPSERPSGAASVPLLHHSILVAEQAAVTPPPQRLAAKTVPSQKPKPAYEANPPSREEKAVNTEEVTRESRGEGDFPVDDKDSLEGTTHEGSPTRPPAAVTTAECGVQCEEPASSDPAPATALPAPASSGDPECLSYLELVLRLGREASSS